MRQLTAALEANANLVLTGLILQEIIQVFRLDAALSRAVEVLEPFRPSEDPPLVTWIMVLPAAIA